MCVNLSLVRYTYWKQRGSGRFWLPGPVDADRVLAVRDGEERTVGLNACAGRSCWSRWSPCGVKKGCEKVAESLCWDAVSLRCGAAGVTVFVLVLLSEVFGARWCSDVVDSRSFCAGGAG